MHFDRAVLEQGCIWFSMLVSLVLLNRDLNRAPYRPAPEQNGWKILRPCISLYALDLVALILVVLFSVSSVAATFVVFSKTGDFKTWLLVVMSPPATMLGLYQLWYTLFVRIGFNESGVDWRGLKRKRFIPWNQIVRVRDHTGLGPRVDCKDGSTFGVWEYLNGFGDFMTMATENGVPIETSIARKHPS